MQKHHKAITLALAVFWLFGMAAYSSSLIGTLFHELSHKSDAVGIKAIEVRYDSSGLATADCFHGETEFTAGWSGAWVTALLIAISTASLFIIVFMK